MISVYNTLDRNPCSSYYYNLGQMYKCYAHTYIAIFCRRSIFFEDSSVSDSPAVSTQIGTFLHQCNCIIIQETSCVRKRNEKKDQHSICTIIYYCIIVCVIIIYLFVYILKKKNPFMWLVSLSEANSLVL